MNKSQEIKDLLGIDEGREVSLGDTASLAVDLVISTDREGEERTSHKRGEKVKVVHDYKDGITDRQWMVTDLSNGPFANRLYMGFINYTYVIENSGLRVITKDSNQTKFSSYKTAYSGSGLFTNLAIDGTGCNCQEG